MARVISPQRLAVIRRASVQNVAETTTLDFDLSADQGIRIFEVRFGVTELILVPGGDNVEEELELSLHAEEGALESISPVDEQRINSEILGLARIRVIGSNTAGEAANSPGTWIEPPVWKYPVGVDIALSPQFRVSTSAAVLTANGPVCWVRYQYLQLTDAELASAFLSRR